MTMPVMRRLQIGELDLAAIDPFERDIQYIYDEIFVGRTYDHPKIRLPERPVVVDVGANVGLFSIWAARTYRPRTILAYEASPTTFACLEENIARHIVGGATTARCFNRAVSRVPDVELVLHQPPWNSGLSTILDGSKLTWINELREKGELNTHTVRSTTISHEIARHGLPTVDLLKVDVEGYFMEVLEGIAADDFAKVRAIVLEAEYTDVLEHSRRSVCELLRARGFEVDDQDAAQVMVYAWRP